MKLTKISKSEISQTKEMPGLLSCRLQYEVKSAQGVLSYTGPKFSPEMWHQVMSFFRWTNKEMHSESQVRLYVNSKLGRWGAWAFPQEARTGMSAREITVQETPEQAGERFASWKSEPSGDWIYFCTVHHHCSAGAFQSGTDENNERGQDGLHITIGRMDADRHDLHARFYVNGNCFDPDLSLFWEIDLALAEMVPPGMLNEIARHQMCEKITVDFPDAWRKNIVEVKSEPVINRGFHDFLPDWERPKDGPGLPSWMRVEKALLDMARQCEDVGITQREYETMLHALSEDSTTGIIIKACVEHGVTPDLLLEEMEHPEMRY